MSDEHVPDQVPEPAPAASTGGAIPPGMSRGKFIMEVVLVRIRFLGLFVIVGVIAGQWDRINAYWEKWTRPEGEHAAEASAYEYFCPMHPQIVRGEPGSCPICGMPLSRRTKGAKEELPEGVLARVQLSPYRIAQAGVRTVAVEPHPLFREVSAVGFVEVDERREKRLAARVPGRADEVLVDFTGKTVAAGDPLVRIYSPELIAAGEALLSSARALETVRASGAGAEDVGRAERVLASARDRLLLWGLEPDQVDRILQARSAETHVTVRSPLAGTVLEKRIVQGQYVMEGDDLYRIADLTTVWVRARIFAGDLDVVAEGREVVASVEGFPGESFPGKVSFVDPVVDPATRTVGVRMDVENATGRLRPGMYVTATIRIPVADLEPFRSRADASPAPGPGGHEGHGGKEAADPGPAGSYWTCTMHPEVVATEAGKCPKCSMDLVKKDLTQGQRVGWWCPMHPEVTADRAGAKCEKCGGMDLVARVVTETPAGSVLAVPELAVVDTGSRKVVYKESSPGVYDAVEVVLGARADGFYPVISGLAGGERVVAAGAFLIDAETRLNPAASAAYFGASGAPSSGAGHGSHGK
ncbi:MAG: efflux RND transporter periplasmic adaptor subunit [Planctomycetaceae bacterium]|nr:efflux RND transporter periplasmic adaptor subunit [Planctomycetota bacterium]NUN51160.1 efflux RND transporter periplasmic adaptor subunit [Planctomycetaceae bacterium]